MIAGSMSEGVVGGRRREGQIPTSNLSPIFYLRESTCVHNQYIDISQSPSTPSSLLCDNFYSEIIQERTP